MAKKTEIPTNNPANVKNQDVNAEGQRPSSYTRDEIASQETDQYNPNSGPRQRSLKKKFK